MTNAGMITLPVAVSIDSTVKFTEYFVSREPWLRRAALWPSASNTISISDAPLVTKVGELYRRAGLPVYERGVQNIEYAVKELKKIQPVTRLRMPF